MQIIRFDWGSRSREDKNKQNKLSDLTGDPDLKKVVSQEARGGGANK